MIILHYKLLIIIIQIGREKIRLSDLQKIYHQCGNDIGPEEAMILEALCSRSSVTIYFNQSNISNREKLGKYD